MGYCVCQNACVFSFICALNAQAFIIVCLSALVSMLAQKQCFGSLKMAVKLRTTYAIFSRFRSTADIVTSCRLLSNHTSMFLK